MATSETLTLLWRIRILAAALTLPPLLRLVQLDRLAGHLGRQARVKRPSADQQSAISRGVDRVLDRLPPPWRKTCLSRSVVLYHLLRRSGIPVNLCVGVKRDGGEFVAHAWLSREGAPYLDTETSGEFKLISSFPRRDPSSNPA